jgi:hypothetical protein
MNLPQLINWETLKLAIMIPWGIDMIWRKTIETLWHLEKPKECELIFGTGRTPARRHEIGCEMSLQWGASHILILGGDQTYPDKQMIRKMFKWMEVSNLEEWMDRKKVINCLVPIRGHRAGQGTRPFQPIGKKINPDTQEIENITRDDPPLVRTEIIGTGVMLFETDILRSMKRPWFADVSHEGTNEVNIMQDVGFVMRLNNLGHQVWCDTQIIVKHLVTCEVDDTWQWRFEK